MKEKRYSVTLINQNGYMIKLESTSTQGAKQAVKHYPLKSFFGWIYDKQTDTMIAQNQYKDRWKKCDNETFIPYY